MRIETVFLSEADSNELIARARQNACAFGISGDLWSKWRKGFGIGRDLLMVIDPDREAERIREAAKRRRRGKGRATLA